MVQTPGTDRELDAGGAAQAVEEHADAVVAHAAPCLSALLVLLPVVGSLGEAHAAGLVPGARHGVEAAQPQGGHGAPRHFNTAG